MAEKKIEEKTEDEIKEKELDDKTEVEVIEEKAKETVEEKEVEKETETPISEAEIVKETELENDPWSEENWKSSFPELFEKEITEKAEGLGKDDVIRICREQIKEWLKGVERGSYPLPKSLKPIESSSPNKTRDIEGLDEQLEKSTTVYKSFEEKFTDIAKTFKEIQKEIQIIKDTPIEIIEKSIDKKDKYIPSVKMDEGTITKR